MPEGYDIMQPRGTENLDFWKVKGERRKVEGEWLLWVQHPVVPLFVRFGLCGLCPLLPCSDNTLGLLPVGQGGTGLLLFRE